MPKIIEWSDQKFYHITIKHKSKIKNNSNRWLWLAICDCGAQLFVLPIQVKTGTIKSCGCKKKTTAKDWSGKSYNDLTFIKPISRTIGSKIRWEAICKCGNTTQVVPYEVTSGKTKSCGLCCRPSTAKDWTNFTRENLTFIKKHKTYKSGQAVWLAQCACGAFIYTVPSNGAKSCGCISKAKCKILCSELGKKGRKYTKIESAARQVYQRYKDGDLDYKSFYELSQKNCHYCNISPQNRHVYQNTEYIYNGLDRINSNLDHSKNNVVPCCRECNLSKREKTVDEFLLHIKRIYEYNFSLSKTQHD